MNKEENIQTIENKIEEIYEKIDLILERQNSQFTELMLEIKELQKNVNRIEENPDSYSDDELFQQSKDIVISTGKASTSHLQRELGIGYSRAAKIIDMLEAENIIGPANGTHPREVYGYKEKI